MHNAFEKKKTAARALIVKREIIEIGGDGQGQSDLISGIPESYGSALFSGLGYEDLRKAHVETVIPVTQEDLKARPVFSNEEELRQHRNAQNHKPMTLAESKQHLNELKEGEDKNDVIRAFKLAKQDEESRRANDKMMSVFKRIGC